MRGGHRVRNTEDEEESAFISMTDMTVGFLFVIMILLAFFATQFAPKEIVPREDYERLAQQLSERDRQISSLLSELEMYRAKGDQSLAWLVSERERLMAEVKLRVGELERIHAALGAAPGTSAEEQVTGLRQEIDRLHQLLKAARESNPIERYNFRVAESRAQLLQRIQVQIKEADASIEVEISRNRDALEFKGDGLFPSGSDIPTPLGRRKMEVIAAVLKRNLGCFAFSAQLDLASSCNPALALIEALQVEGHTDSSGDETMNMNLSSRRGSSIYAIMATAAPDILRLHNLRGQPILSVAGYGEGRPIADNSSIQGRDTNRRIDLRFIMFSPAEERFVPQKVDDLPRMIHLLAGGIEP